jgi:tryptophan synthase alpha chain
MSDPAMSRAEPIQSAEGRIAARFRRLAKAGELGLVAYITAGDPSLEATGEIVLAADAAGADVIELGVPFSDPLADGPVIQRASERALRGGTSLRRVLELVKRLRAKTEIPFVLFSYFNPIYQMGLERFAAAASDAGTDGVLATDLTPEEAGSYRGALRAKGLDTIFLAAPTSTGERLKRIAETSSGFLYLISRTGVTGARDVLPEGVTELARRARNFTKLPIAIGFGISRPEHVSGLFGVADAAVVGSALVAEIEKASGAAAAAVAALISRLKGAGRKSNVPVHEGGT